MKCVECSKELENKDSDHRWCSLLCKANFWLKYYRGTDEKYWHYVLGENELKIKRGIGKRSENGRSD